MSRDERHGYTFGSGLAKVISGGPFPVSLQPYAGSSTFLPLLNTGEVELGIVKLAPIHPLFKEWTRERAVDPEERVVWTLEIERAEQRLLTP